MRPNNPVMENKESKNECQAAKVTTSILVYLQHKNYKPTTNIFSFSGQIEKNKTANWTLMKVFLCSVCAARNLPEQ